MEFRKCTLGDLSLNGRGEYGIAASAVEYNPEKKVYLRITDICDDGTLDNSDRKSVEGVNLDRYILKPNDIVFARTGASTGRNYFYDGTDGEMVFAGFLIKFSIDERAVNPKFIKYYCLSKKYKAWIQSFATGSTRGNINAQTLASMPIDLPPRDYQNRMVEILDIIDLKIKENKAINHNLQQQVFTLYRQMFVDSPNDNRKICRADEYFDISIGKTPPRKEPEWFKTVRAENVVWVSIADMGNCGLFINNSSEYLSLDAVKKYNVAIVPDNTVMVSFKLTVGRIAISDGWMTTNEAIAHFKTENKAINEYLFCYLKSYNFQTLGSTSSIATAVNSKIIKAMPFVVPTDEELSLFHNFAAPVFEKIKACQRENASLAELRDSLLPKLMSGVIDVSEVEI